MKAESGIKRNTLKEYKNKLTQAISKNKKPAENSIKKSLSKGEKFLKSSSVKLSDKAKALASQQKLATNIAGHLASKTVTGAISSILSSKGDSKEEGPKNLSAVAPDKVDNESKPEKVTNDKKKKADEIKKLKDIKKVIKKSSKGTLRKPGLFFITGMESFSVSTDYDGIRKMAEAVKGARVYSWDQKDEIIKEIQKRTPNQPIVLVGHSYGGDTAVEISEEMNSLDHGFRNIDLLVTIDSVGSDNDIIPQNVKRNLNFFGENSNFFNDGPNVARNNGLTSIINELRPEEHTELDNSKDIQYKIMTELNNLLD